jgi:HAD superfamily hydrolase (TIGR01459 family)
VSGRRRGSRFLAFARQFPIVFFDQYGVLHDGRAPYPGAVEALRALKAHGARIVILSNSGRSGDHNARRMATIGIGDDLYDHFVTSGDVAAAKLRKGALPPAMGGAMRCLTLSTSGDDELARGLGFTSVDEAAKADLVVISGSQTDRISLEDYATLLAPAAERRAQCVCTNPDRLMLHAKGVLPGPGAIADVYRRLGGPVIWIGKPYPSTYEHARELVSPCEREDILCVGDSVEHDIVGAHRFGAAAALVRTGILASLSEPELARACAEHGVVPDIVVADLR